MPFLIAVKGFNASLEGKKRYDLDELLAKAKKDRNNVLKRIRIGRSGESEIRVPPQGIESLSEEDQYRGRHISRTHAVIWKANLGENEKYVIKDGGLKRSNTGTFAEDKSGGDKTEEYSRIRPLEYFTAAGFKVLEDGDLIYLGHPREDYCQVFKYVEK